MFTWFLALNVKRMPLRAPPPGVFFVVYADKTPPCTFGSSSEKLQSGQHGHGGRVLPEALVFEILHSIYLDNVAPAHSCKWAQ
jgi:hypothetical protein